MHLFYTGHKHYTQFSTNILILTIFITQSLSRYILFVRPNLSDQRHTTHLLAFSFCHKYFSCIHILKTLGHLDNRAHIRSLADFGQTPRLEFYFNLWLTSSRWFKEAKSFEGKDQHFFLSNLICLSLDLDVLPKDTLYSQWTARSGIKPERPGSNQNVEMWDMRSQNVIKSGLL